MAIKIFSFFYLYVKVIHDFIKSILSFRKDVGVSSRNMPDGFQEFKLIKTSTEPQILNIIFQK